MPSHDTKRQTPNTSAECQHILIGPTKQIIRCLWVEPLQSDLPGQKMWCDTKYNRKRRNDFLLFYIIFWTHLVQLFVRQFRSGFERICTLCPTGDGGLTEHHSRSVSRHLKLSAYKVWKLQLAEKEEWMEESEAVAERKESPCQHLCRSPLFPAFDARRCLPSLLKVAAILVDPALISFLELQVRPRRVWMCSHIACVPYLCCIAALGALVGEVVCDWRFWALRYSFREVVQVMCCMWVAPALIVLVLGCGLRVLGWNLNCEQGRSFWRGLRRFDVYLWCQ